jgi:hypothetical protein
MKLTGGDPANIKNNGCLRMTRPNGIGLGASDLLSLKVVPLTGSLFAAPVQNKSQFSACQSQSSPGYSRELVPQPRLE